MPSQFLFTPLVGTSQTQREKELDQAARKAHTARINHGTRKRKLKEAKATAPAQWLYPQDTNGLIPDCHPDAVDPESSYQLQLEEFRGRRLSCDTNLWHSLAESNLTITRFSGGLTARWGNSDPFSCQVIPVTPRTNQVISFFRFYSTRSWSTSFMLQLLRDDIQQTPPYGKDNAVGLAAAASLWKLLLRHPTGFWPVVASLIPVMRRLMPEDVSTELMQLGLQMKSHNLKGLREALKSFESMTNPPITLVYHVKGLFREACTNGDPESARVHAKMLCKFSERLASSRRNIASLRMGLWSDAASALMQQRRPLFDAVDWMPRTLTTIWRLADEVLPSFANAETDVLLSISNPVLREAFIHIRQALQVCERPKVTRCEEDVQQAEIIFHWANTKAEHHMCCLLNLYFDLIERVPNDAMTEGQRFTEAALAVALLHILQKSFCDATQADGVDIHESAPVIHPILQKVTEQAMQQSTEFELVHSETVYFWVLYVGAYCEERLYCSNLRKSDASGSPRLPKLWFHEQLRLRASQLRLFCWEDAKRVLNQLVIVDYLYPHPQHWFESWCMKSDASLRR